MMRYIGRALLCGGLCMLGICAAQRLKRRERNLSELICGFEAVRRELKYNLAPLAELFKLGASQTTGEVSAFFSKSAECANELNGVDFKTKWIQVIEERWLELTEADILVLKQLGGTLGRYDVDEQARALDVTIERLRELRRLADERSIRIGKVYNVLGIISGAFAFLLFL